MKAVFIILLPLFLFGSCGPQDGTQRQSKFPQQGQNNTNQDQGTPPTPGAINPQTSANYLENLEKLYPCGARMRKKSSLTSHSQTTIKSINSIHNYNPHSGPIFKKYVGKSSDNHLIYVEQISQDGVNSIGFNITFSFCERLFPRSQKPLQPK